MVIPIQDVLFFIKKSLKYLINLSSDWDNVNSWCDEYSQDLAESIISRDYLHALNSFDLGDFNNVAKCLEKVSYFSTSMWIFTVFQIDIFQELLQFQISFYFMPFVQVPGGNITNLAEEFSRKGSLRVNQVNNKLSTTSYNFGVANHLSLFTFSIHKKKFDSNKNSSYHQLLFYLFKN